MTAALAATREWLEKAVIGLNLCPFAKAVHLKDQIRWVESAATEAEALLADLVHELRVLASADPDAIETTVFVHPQALTDFDDYNDFLDVVDAALAELGLDGELQVASFHPQYRFDGTDDDDVTNFTNRSPFPTLHLLRESSVERALASFPDAAAIFERNQATLRGLGLAGWRALFAA